MKQMWLAVHPWECWSGPTDCYCLSIPPQADQIGISVFLACENEKWNSHKRFCHV